jgi:hypothetical protein
MTDENKAASLQAIYFKIARIAAETNPIETAAERSLHEFQCRPLEADDRSRRPVSPVATTGATGRAMIYRVIIRRAVSTERSAVIRSFNSAAA